MHGELLQKAAGNHYCPRRYVMTIKILLFLSARYFYRKRSKKFRQAFIRHNGRI